MAARPPAANAPKSPQIVPGVPLSLRVAAGVAAVEGLGAAVAGVWMVAQIIADRPVGLAIALSTAGFVLASAAVLVVLAVGLVRKRRWSRGLAVFVQLLMLPIGYELAESPTMPVGVAMIALALAGLVTLLLPSTTAVFKTDRDQRTF
jgi:uncharacterized membrane protein (DUF2068 family)